MSKAEQVSIISLDLEHPSMSLFENSAALTTLPPMEVLDWELNHTALEVLKLIHGTAFSLGFPDAWTTWKPKFHYSEVDGWISDIGACL